MAAATSKLPEAGGNSDVRKSSGCWSRSGDRSWQSILDGLTVKAKREGLVRSVKNAKTFTDKLRKVKDSIAIRGKLSAWISECAESQYSKSGGTATKLRDEGNFKFRCHEYESSLKLYTESVICAPEFGPELSLAYGNRSACLYYLGHFKDCLQDIYLALRYRFPKNLEHKLYQRRGQCHTKLGNAKEAEEAFKAAISALDLVPKLNSEKKESLIRDINALLKESGMVNNGLNSAGESLEPPTCPSYGPHSSLKGASMILSLESSPSKGRHILVHDDVATGDVLFSELPYSSVLLPEHYSTHCHHCYQEFIAPIPCIRCTQPRYCSEACRQESWDIYHQYECTGLDLLHSVGIAHLALRTVLVCGIERLLCYQKQVDKTVEEVEKMAMDESGYIDVFNLVTHVDHLNPDDLFQYAVTAALLTTYLERRTTFFESANLELSLDALRIGNRGRRKSEIDNVDEDLLLYVGGVMLRHITQLICNASAIYEVGNTSEIDEETSVVSNSQFRIATAIYPSASMMNHSCDPSVINSFHCSRLIVRAIKPIKKGAEVFNCYGPHFRHQPLSERQEILRSQYHFTCSCTSCSRKELNEFHERFSALKCVFCEGPIKNPSSETALKQQMPCLDCGREQEYSSQIEQVFLAYDLFKKGMECLRFGNMNDALPALQSCYQLRMKAMYAHHLEVTEVADQLAKCYAMMGSFSESAQYLKVCLPAVQERFGVHSIEVGNELIKYTDVLLGDLQDSTKRISLFEEKILESRKCLEKAAEIFALHYGKWHKSYREIQQKLEKMQFLVPIESF